MKSLKSLITLTIFLLLSLVVTSCGASEPNEDNSSSSNGSGDSYSLKIAGDRTYQLTNVNGYYCSYVSIQENNTIEVYKNNNLLEVQVPSSSRLNSLEDNNIKKDLNNKLYAVEGANKALFELDVTTMKVYLGHKAYCLYANNQEVATLTRNYRGEGIEYYAVDVNLDGGVTLKVEYDGHFVDDAVRKNVSNNNINSSLRVIRSGSVSAYFNATNKSLFVDGYYDLHEVSINGGTHIWVKPINGEYVAEDVPVNAGDQLTFYTDGGIRENIPISPYNRDNNNIDNDYKIRVAGKVNIYINPDGQLYVTGYKKLYNFSIGNKTYEVEDGQLLDLDNVKKGDVITATSEGSAVPLLVSPIKMAVDNFIEKKDDQIIVKRDSLEGEKPQLSAYYDSSREKVLISIDGYSPIYKVTIGSNTYTLTRNNGTTEALKYEYYYVSASVKKGDAITVTLDGDTFAPTRKLDADTTPINEINNIVDSSGSLSIHNDANPAAIYIDYLYKTIYVSGYHVNTDEVAYYVDIDGVKTPLTPDANNMHQHYAKGVTVSNGSVFKIYDANNNRVTAYEHADNGSGNNLLAPLTIYNGGTVDIYLKTNDKNIWVTQPYSTYELVQDNAAYTLSQSQYLFVYSWVKLGSTITVDRLSYIENGSVEVLDNFTGIIVGYLYPSCSKEDGLGQYWANRERQSEDFSYPGNSFSTINVSLDGTGKPVVTVS